MEYWIWQKNNEARLRPSSQRYPMITKNDHWFQKLY
jgi:hypothetical protein